MRRMLLIIFTLILTGCGTLHTDWVYQPMYRNEIYIPQPFVGYSFYNRYLHHFNPYTTYRPINPYYHWIYQYGTLQIWSNQICMPWQHNYVNYYRFNNIATQQGVRPASNTNKIVVMPRRHNTSNYVPRNYPNRVRPISRVKNNYIRKSPNQTRLQPTKNIKGNGVIPKKIQSHGKRTGNIDI